MGPHHVRKNAADPVISDEDYRAALWSAPVLAREADGRWIAEIPEIPGCMIYGETEESARAACVDLAVRITLTPPPDDAE